MGWENGAVVTEHTFRIAATINSTWAHLVTKKDGSAVVGAKKKFRDTTVVHSSCDLKAMK